MIKIGVISDIHSHVQANDKPQGGYYFPSMPDKPVSQNPFSALKELIRKKEIKFDYLLTPGDYAHQIDEIGLKSSWDQLKLVCIEVNAKMLVGTIGNHDVESRGGPSGEQVDPFRHIKSFDLDFPVFKSSKSENFRNDLLDKSYYHFEDEELDILIVVVNSCFDHWSSVLASKGKVKRDKLDEVSDLINKSSKKLKLLMVHHHPIVHETGIGDTFDCIEGSEDFMKAVKGIDFIIHGHKHDFRFQQLNIFPQNLNVLGAGSFACYKTSLKTYSQNYFHEILIETKELKDCKNFGIIKTYVYDPLDGWSLDKTLQEGFGCVLNLSEIKELIKKIINDAELPYIQWDEIVEKDERLRYISKLNRNEALDLLKKSGEVMRFNTDKFRNAIGDIILK